MDFITSREIAMLFWAGLAILCIMLVNNARLSLKGLAKALFHKKIISILLCFFLYCLIVLTYLDTKLPFAARHYWIALLWIFISGYKSVFITISKSADFKTGFLLDAILSVISITALIEIMVSLRSFHWTVELILLPVVLIALYISIKHDRNSNPNSIMITCQIILSALGVILITYSVFSLITDSTAFINGSFLLEISLPAILTLFCIPFLYGLFLIVCYETSMTRLPSYLNDIKLMSYARTSSALAFAWDVESLKNWITLVQTNKPDSKLLIQESISVIYKKTSLRTRVYTTKGDGSWNPSDAEKYLAHIGLPTNKYHADEFCESEWRASSTYHLIGNDPIENAIAYYIYGEEFRACKLLIKLNVQVPTKFDEAWIPFKEYISELSIQALPISTSDRIQDKISEPQPFSIVSNTHTVSLTMNAWEHNINGGYDMAFTIVANS